MNDHWLVRESTIRWLWTIFIAVLVVLILLDVVVQHHVHFRLERIFGFGAWFGFLSCVVLIVLAKALGFLLKRWDTYYDR
jgi:hypothetical protein